MKEEDDIREYLKNKNSAITSTHHSLFIKEILPNAESVGDDLELYRLTPEYNEYTLYLGNFDESNRGLHELLHTLRDASASDELKIIVHSYGGSVDEGKQLYNIINDTFLHKTTTVLDTAGYSMGALAFCMGDERIIYEHSTLMFHDYSGGSIGKGGEIESQVIHTSQSVRNFFYSIVIPNNFLTAEEFEAMLIGQDFWMDSIEMCERGIATHIMVHNNKVLSEHYLRHLDGDISYKEMISGEIIPKPVKPKKKKNTKKKKKKIIK